MQKFADVIDEVNRMLGCFDQIGLMGQSNGIVLGREKIAELMFLRAYVVTLSS